MGYLYRYELKNKDERLKNDLRNYDKEIRLTLKEVFHENLKNCDVQEKQFEFRLFKSVTSDMLRKMGRVLKSKIGWQTNNKRKRGSFVRMKQNYYALLYPYLKNNEIYSVEIELIDSMLIDDYDKFKYKADEYFRKEDTYNNDLIERTIINLHYLDVINAEINYDQLNNIFNCMMDKYTERNLYCYLIEGIPSKFSKRVCKDDEMVFDESFDFVNSKIKESETGHYDGLRKIKVIKEANNEIRLIKERTHIDLGKIKDTEKIVEIKPNTRAIFKVHNVGQALATSIAYESKKPILYFDYGIPFGKNKDTNPNTTDLLVDENTKIIISHIHQDHWYGASKNLDSLMCSWFIPDQDKKVYFDKLVGEIKLKGGTVSIIDKNIEINIGNISSGGPKKFINNDKNIHKTGLTLRLQGRNDNDDKINIFVAGDQVYDNVNSKLLEDIDILVATHHGGEYYFKDIDSIPIPRNKKSKIVYSCGFKNSYNHPSMVHKYQEKNWANEHITHEKNDFVEYICFDISEDKELLSI